jgi:succinate dehydrogenase / fumarate reductase iron-sulfur subunit
MNLDERLDAMMSEGGVADCGNAQNCVEVCPKEIPLTTAIGAVGRQTSIKWLRDLFMK